MKKLFSALLAIVLACSVSAAGALTFSSLSTLQNFLEKHSPAQIMAAGQHYVNIEGTVESISWTGKNNHYDFILLVDDSKAIPPIGSDSPQLRVHFRLHLDQPPFQVGDTVTVYGTLNELYSSVIVPFILAETINGSEDF